MPKRQGKRVSRAEARAADAKADAKEQETKVRTAGAPGLPLPKKAAVLDALEQVKNIDAKLETLRGKRRLLFKGFKAQHISAQLIKDLITLERGDEDEFRAELEKLAIGLQAVGAPFQLNVFDTLYKDDVAQAKVEGRKHAEKGQAMDCRFAEGSPAAEAYVEAYQLQQAKMVPGAQDMTEAELAAAFEKRVKSGGGGEEARH